MCNNKITFIILVDDGNVSELEGCINSIENIPKGNYTICICDNRSEINEDNITENYEVFVIEKNEIEVIKNICNEINSDYVQILTAGDRVSIDWLYDIEKNEHSDIIIGSQIYRGSTGEFIYNLSSEGVFKNENTIDDVLKFYFLSGGEDRYIREIDNKVISRKIMLQVLETVKQENNMFLYWEIGLKSLVMAQNISFVEDGYVSYDMKNDSKIFEKIMKRFY